METFLDPNFLNPNIAYLLIAAGIFFVVMSMLSPGTGILEILALITIVLAGWAIYSLQEIINWWALVVLLVGFVLFFLALRYPKRIAYLIAAIAALVIGSAFLFSSGDWLLPAVNPFLALAVSLFMGGFFWVAGRKIIEAREAGRGLGVYDNRGSLKEDIARSLVENIGSERIMFEAPEKCQQAHLILLFGPEVNLGNISPEDVIPLETLRRGIRAETYGKLQKG